MNKTRKTKSKKTTAYEVICSSYIVKSMEKHKLFEGKMELNISHIFKDHLGERNNHKINASISAE